MPFIRWVKQRKTLLMVLLDILIISGTYFVVIKYETGYITPENKILAVLIPTVMYIVSLFLFQVYGSIWRYADVEEFFRCASSTMLAGIIYAVAYELVVGNISISNHIFATLLITLMLVFYRCVYRLYGMNSRIKTEGAIKRLLIVGAGMAATSLISEIRKNSNNRFLPVCVVDDNPEKYGKFINGLKIRGSADDIPKLCNEYEIDTIFICIPSATLDQRRRILDICAKTNARIKILPEVYAAITDPGRLQSIMRTIRIEDLIGRQEKHFDRSCIDSFIKDKTVLITGGGGSIGSELCRQVALSKPKKLIILDSFESNAFSIQQELVTSFGSNLDIAVEIATIREAKKVDKLFSEYLPDVVFHAAAHKHVPLMEHNPDEAIKNNVWGTLNVVNTSQKYKVKNFVLISSDKAVNPTNVMGATKRFAEMIVQSRKGVSSTRFAAVRFGNVLGSSGSVVPMFERQIEQGGPVTVTHSEITRFFMTIPEAVQLVLQAAVMAKDGEIFVLDMGEPVRILQLAETMIRLSGLRPYEDIDVVFTGLRPGEKLYEELLMNEEGLESTANSRIFIGHQPQISVQEIEQMCKKLDDAVNKNDKNNLLHVMQEVVPTYKPDFSSCKNIYPLPQELQG
ncbi:MAG: nucleoside-diphosphate sugar epimerase/dehydratase [Oscillospiraceae bacterium]|nr:nucleoside-diphosphate sugar epimerase/dehydratase [Oscillospiraceae bacterium]